MLIIERRQFRIGKQFYILTGLLMLIMGAFGALLTMHVHMGRGGEDPVEPKGK